MIPNTSRPLSLKAIATQAHDLDTRRALVVRFTDLNVRDRNTPELARAVMELQAAGASLTRVQAHLGRQLLVSLTDELGRRQALAAQQPVRPLPSRAGGYSAAVGAVVQAHNPKKYDRYA